MILRHVTVGRRLAIATVVAASVAVTGAGMVALAGTATAASGCAVTYTVTSQWAGGFVADVGVRNLGDPVNGWRLAWSYASGQRVASAWNATVTQDGTQVTAVNAGHNGTLATNGSTTFGLQGSWTGTNPAPTAFALNGVACTGGTTPGTPTAPPTVAPTVAPTATPTAGPSQPAGCPAAGHVTYTLTRAANPTADQLSAYNLITTAMDQATAFYNCQTNITKALRISYDPSVSTADGNINGSIRFGARNTMQRITAMHEIGHTVGVGTASAWSSKLSNGVWTGSAATAELRALTGDQAAVLHGDSAHFWPYGLNYTSEVKSDQDLIFHCRLVVALRRDMGMA